MASVNAFIAANRFGLGARPGDLSTIDKDPQHWLESQIARGATIPSRLKQYSGTKQRLAAITNARRESNRQAGKIARSIAMEQSAGEIIDRFTTRLETDTPFTERLVSFWANHFSISRNKQYLPALTPAYEREAIRPHIFGSFGDLLVAAVTHPAMLIYLDNVQSIGPNSFFGKRRDRTINENLAREVLELHTLGVDGGYTQEDIEEFAKALSGWAYAGLGRVEDNARIQRSFGGAIATSVGEATFYAPLHEPGPKRVLGRRYPEDGAGEPLAILKDLAQHPSTATFIATKLARHFIADDPPQTVVRALARRYRETDGHLASIYRTLIGLTEVWATPLPKVKPPQDFIVSGLRALGIIRMRGSWFRDPLTQMGHSPFNAPSPQGWPDVAEAWISPGSLMRRVEWARSIVDQVDTMPNPQTLLEDTIGPVATKETRTLVRGAPSGAEAVGFVLASIEHQRR